jgi:polysaccharide pyruvyl transferase WcaK-like protein
MLAGRMHAGILAAGAGTPVLGLAYNQKFKGFLGLIDPQSMPIQIEEFVATKGVENLAARLQSLLGARDLYTERIAALRQRTAAYMRELLAATGLGRTP